MRYSKISASRTPLRKFAHSDRLLGAHTFPAWIDSGTGVPFSSVAVVSPRVRDSLVLRLVAKRHHRDLSDARCVR
jgi:hypothetical protein